MTAANESNLSPLVDGLYGRIALPKRGSFSFWRQVRMGVALALLLAGLNLLGPGDPSLEQRCLASAIIVVAAIPLWLWSVGVDRSIPFAFFVSMMFAGYYALPVFLLKRYRVELFGGEPSETLIVKALVLSLAALACMLLGYYGPVRVWLAPLVPRFNLRWQSLRNVKRWAFVFALSGLALTAFEAVGRSAAGLQMALTFGQDLAIVSILILFALQLAGRLDRKWVLFLWGALVPARLFLGLATGATAQVLVLALMLTLLYASLRRVIPWKAIVIGACAFFILRPAQMPFRSATWAGGRMEKASTTAKVRLFSDILTKTLSGRWLTYDRLLQLAAGRLALFATFAEVLRDTPDHVPYWRGETYYPILFKPLPRLLYPDKPVEISGQRFGHRYGILALRNQTTSINLAQTIELYANFGVPGVLMGMFLFGLAYRLIIQIYVHPGMGLGALIASVYISSKLLNIGSSASLAAGAVLWSMVFVALIHLLVQSGELGARVPGVTRPGSLSGARY